MTWWIWMGLGFVGGRFGEAIFRWAWPKIKKWFVGEQPAMK